MDNRKESDLSDGFIRSAVDPGSARRVTHAEHHATMYVAEVGGILKKLLGDLADQHANLEVEVTIDPRWFAVGKTHLEQGLMALNRAILRPDGL